MNHRVASPAPSVQVLFQHRITEISESSRADEKHNIESAKCDPASLLALWTPIGGPTEVLGMHLFFLLVVADRSYLPSSGE